MLRVGLVHLCWNRRREGGSFAVLASDGHISAHELAELPTQGQSQTGSALFLGGRNIGLRKGLKEAAQLFRSPANTAIDDIEHDVASVTTPSKKDGSLVGELA